MLGLIGVLESVSIEESLLQLFRFSWRSTLISGGAWLALPLLSERSETGPGVPAEEQESMLVSCPDSESGF